MKLLINDKELVNFLISLTSFEKEINEIKLEEIHVAEAIGWVLALKADIRKYNKRKEKIPRVITDAVKKDLSEYIDKVKLAIQNKKAKQEKLIKTKLNVILSKLGEEQVLKEYKKSKVENYVKSIGLAIDKRSVLIRREKFNDIESDCVLRNTVGNESLLVNKIVNNKPFWFIDSGYTNFLESKKKWHRLVRNHLHFGNDFIAPVDRLGMFNTFPQQWRTSGDRILIIEPGPFAAAIFQVDIKQWKYNVEAEIRQYTDKKIIFREKAPKKVRQSLYEHLCNEDYYCVVSINSNAATESIWAGIPVITLDKHISNPVSRNKLSDINSLYTGPLANWLATLSYSQFTFDELVNGTALKIIRKYHG